MSDLEDTIEALEEAVELGFYFEIGPKDAAELLAYIRELEMAAQRTEQ